MELDNPPPEQVNSKDISEFNLPPAKRQRVGELTANGDAQSVSSLNAETNTGENQGGVTIAAGASISQTGDKTGPTDDQRTWRKGEAPVKAESVFRSVI
jgi:hypothetical protein